MYPLSNSYLDLATAMILTGKESPVHIMAQDSLPTSHYEEQKLICNESEVQRHDYGSPRCRQHSRTIGTLSAVVFLLAVTCMGLFTMLVQTYSGHKCEDPTLAVFCMFSFDVRYTERGPSTD